MNFIMQQLIRTNGYWIIFNQHFYWELLRLQIEMTIRMYMRFVMATWRSDWIFLDAIERKWLAPFKYFGVYDDTDYSQITWLGTRYDEG